MMFNRFGSPSSTNPCHSAKNTFHISDNDSFEEYVTPGKMGNSKAADVVFEAEMIDAESESREGPEILLISSMMNI
jgi:hypothetical protein